LKLAICHSRPINRARNKNLFFKEPIKIDGYYFVPSGKPGLGYEYDEKFVVSRKRLA
jgi:L-alanine-DL-glutamate epimerase-like enolase superfamily enzyme